MIFSGSSTDQNHTNSSEIHCILGAPISAHILESPLRGRPRRARHWRRHQRYHQPQRLRRGNTLQTPWVALWGLVKFELWKFSVSASSESSGGVFSKTMDLVCGPPKGPRLVHQKWLAMPSLQWAPHRNELSTLEDSSTTIAATLRVPMTRGQLAREAAIFLNESDEWER